MTRSGGTRIAATIAVVVAVAGCGGLPVMREPVGIPVLPDLSPEPPVDVRTTEKDDRILIRFSSTLVNVGDGDFVLRAVRQDANWAVEQEIWYSEQGGEIESIPARMVWGGDGHEHWHIERVASYRLVPLDDLGNPVNEEIGVDTKIGFCFFDHTDVLHKGPEEGIYDVHDCGHETDDSVRMGMSPGWGDIYAFTLPGQSIDITELPDGDYRLWAEADTGNWFIEVTRDNNRTWVDLEISTRSDGARLARVFDIGPKPGE